MALMNSLISGTPFKKKFLIILSLHTHFQMISSSENFDFPIWGDFPMWAMWALSIGEQNNEDTTL